MTKALSSYPEERRTAVAMRRTQRYREKGNGYWAAVAYLATMNLGVKGNKEAARNAIQSGMVNDIKKVMNIERVAS